MVAGALLLVRLGPATVVMAAAAVGRGAVVAPPGGSVEAPAVAPPKLGGVGAPSPPPVEGDVVAPAAVPGRGAVESPRGAPAAAAPPVSVLLLRTPPPCLASLTRPVAAAAPSVVARWRPVRPRPAASPVVATSPVVVSPRRRPAALVAAVLLLEVLAEEQLHVAERPTRPPDPAVRPSVPGGRAVEGTSRTVAATAVSVVLRSRRPAPVALVRLPAVVGPAPVVVAVPPLVDSAVALPLVVGARAVRGTAGVVLAGRPVVRTAATLVVCGGVVPAPRGVVASMPSRGGRAVPPFAT